MGDDKTKWSNVIIGPWESSEKLQNSKPLKGGKTREQMGGDDFFNQFWTKEGKLVDPAGALLNRFE